jgi:ATP-dependent exoDNAse (exonuclease V) alpha subunit
MTLAQQMPKTKEQKALNSLVTPNDNIHWENIKKKYTRRQLNDMPNWIVEQREIDNDIIENNNNQAINLNNLNTIQKFTYNLVDKFHKENKQLLMILLGTAGTGKSFTVSALSQLKNNILKRASPTGKAAFLINGETLHSLFNIKVVENENESFLELENNELANLQKDFENIEFLIIDEFSMMSQIMLGKIDSRLRQAKNKNELFGGISIMLIGDPGQLPPVGGSTLFENKKLNNTLAISGYLAYKKFKIVITLEAMMRQKNLNNDPQQAHFMALLPRLRDGTSTLADWELLCTRFINDSNLKQYENEIRIFNDNASVDNYNIEILTATTAPKAELKAINSSKKGQNSSSQNFSGLSNYVYIANDLRITLTNNIWNKKGLCNGTNGIIKVKLNI